MKTITNPHFGIIITRHVRSVETNNYWNHSILCINKLYKNIKIVIIDDNSDKNFVRPLLNVEQYKNVFIIQSEYKGAGEMLPYYYFIHNHFFDNALIMHDSVFLHNRVAYEKLILSNVQVLPLWFFFPDKENLVDRMNIASNLTNFHLIKPKLELDISTSIMPYDKWYGCFGVQSFINRNFLLKIQEKYTITNLVHVVKKRSDRQTLERIMGCIFFTEYNNKSNKNIPIRKSILGNIMTYQNFGYSFSQYRQDLKQGKINKSVVKVWTGR